MAKGHGGEPGTVPRADLPELTHALAEVFITKAADIMRAQLRAAGQPGSEGFPTTFLLTCDSNRYRPA